MKNIMNILDAHPQVSGYKISISRTESRELFFVKGKLETVRCTDNCDREITVYADHGDFKGEAQFFVYPSTTDEQVKELIDGAVSKALLINNEKYDLPAGETGEYQVESNFSSYDSAALAAEIAKAVFAADGPENSALNSVEIFVYKYTDTIINSRGLNKTQVRYRAMVEAIPTYNGAEQSVELYQQHNFGHMDAAAVTAEIADKLRQVKARYEAVTPDFAIDCPVVLPELELASLFRSIASNLNYSAVYSHSNLFKKGDLIQKDPCGDAIGITMAGQVKGSVSSTCFDGDGLSLENMRIVDSGKAVNYYGSNRYGQYLGEKPTGSLSCLCADCGTASAADFDITCLEVASMSGLQVDFHNDYIGGEVRLAYYRDSGRITPVTGISISGKLSDVLANIRFSEESAIYGAYSGPAKAILSGMKVF